MAGVELVPSIDFEIANINIYVNKDTRKDSSDALVKPEEPLGDGLSSVAWHYDSFPFV